MVIMFQLFLNDIMFKFLKNIWKNKVTNNPKNIVFEFQSLYDKIGFFPRNDEQIYIKSLTHSSYNKKTYNKNERLEFLGDALISFVIAEILYEKFEDKNEGLLTRLRAKIVNRKYLNNIGFELQLHHFLKHKLQKDFYKNSPDIIGNAFEALIGAYYVDLGFEDAKKVVKKLLLSNIDYDELLAQSKDKKSYLYEWCQIEKKQLFFKHININNSRNDFHVKIYIDEKYISEGVGKTKKEAEQDASSNACLNLKI